MTNNIIVKDTLEAWQPHYTKKLTENDGKEIQNNLSDFATCLQSWQNNEKRAIAL